MDRNMQLRMQASQIMEWIGLAHHTLKTPEQAYAWIWLSWAEYTPDGWLILDNAHSQEPDWIAPSDKQVAMLNGAWERGARPEYPQED